MVSFEVSRSSDRHSYRRISGRVDPIPFHVKQDMTGLGKYGQDARMIETTVSQRRELASERHLKESDDQRAEREVRRCGTPTRLGNSRHDRIPSLAERISNPKSLKLFDLSIVQCAINSSRTLLSMTNIATRMPTTIRSGSRICG